MRNFLSEHPSKSVSTRNGHQSKQATRVNSGFDTWGGLGTESFFATPTSSPQISKPVSEGNNAQPFGKAKDHRYQASFSTWWMGRFLKAFWEAIMVVFCENHTVFLGTLLVRQMRIEKI